MKRHLKMTIVLILLSSSLFADIINGKQSFNIEITKIGESDFGFCTAGSVTNGSIEELTKGIVFENWDSSEQVTETTIPPKTSFGLFWDLYFETAGAVSLDLTFSASNTGSYEHMLESKEGAVLNFSAAGTVYENRDVSKGKTITGISVPATQVNQGNFPDRSMNILKAEVEAYDHMEGSALIELTLNFPTDGGSPINFTGGEYNGYAIFSVSVN